MKKNTFLYIVIAVLVTALAGLGALNVRTLDKLASLQSKVNELQKNVQEVSDSAAELSSKADQLDALYPDDPTVASAAANAQTDISLSICSGTCNSRIIRIKCIQLICLAA